MTPEQLIKREIIHRAIQSDSDLKWEGELTADNIDEVYESLGDDSDTLNDLERWDFRAGEVETGIECETSRHYESKSVACKLSDGTWVGWTYWYGGGKHAEPECVDWMSDAYILDVTEEEKLVTVRTFQKREAIAP